MTTPDTKTHVTLPSEREILITRTFNAPRALVFAAWTTPEHLAKWWGPRGWTTTIKTLELKPGGTWHYLMVADEGGHEGWSKATYREIVPPERLVYVDVFADADGNPIPGLPESTVTIEFSEADGKTTVASTTLFPSMEARDSILSMGLAEGIAETWDRLEEYLPTL